MTSESTGEFLRYFFADASLRARATRLLGIRRILHAIFSAKPREDRPCRILALQICHRSVF